MTCFSLVWKLNVESLVAIKTFVFVTATVIASTDVFAIWVFALLDGIAFNASKELAVFNEWDLAHLQFAFCGFAQLNFVMPCRSLMKFTSAWGHLCSPACPSDNSHWIPLSSRAGHLGFWSFVAIVNRPLDRLIDEFQMV